MKQTCILVLGMHRSGTSALTGVLSLLDVYLADTTRGDENNKKGYFENSKVQQLNDKIFTSVDSNWQDEFFNLSKIEDMNFDLKEFMEIIKSDFEYSERFAIKDPRVCFLFPLWEKALKKLNVNIKIILPYRNPIEVANSLNKRDCMPLEKGMLLWAYHFLLAEKFSREYDRVFVNFDELISDTSKVIEDLSKKLHTNFLDKFNKNKKDIEEFLEPSLKHHNISIDNLSDNTPKIVKDILTLKDKFNDTNLFKEFDTLRYELFSYQKLFYNASIVSSLDEGQRVKQNLQIKEQELNQTKQNLQTKEQELNQTKQNLQTKEQELNQTKQNLQTKEQELNQTKQNLQTKEQELNQTKQELESIKIELANIYTSKSWKLTRPLRRFIRIVKK